MYRLIASFNQDIWIFPLPETEARLGAASENDLILPAPGVSRRHALLRRSPGGVEITDLHSRNGLRVAGRQVERALLTAGLRVQLGSAWLELEELSSAEAELSACLDDPVARRARASLITDSVTGEEDRKTVSSPEAALAIACHLELVDANDPEERKGILARARTALGADALAFFEREQRSKIALRESDGVPLPEMELERLRALAMQRQASLQGEVRLKRAGNLLLAMRDPYLLIAQFRDECQTNQTWRQDFLRFLFLSTFIPAKHLKQTARGVIQRVFLATGGNASGTARTLGLTRPTVKSATKRLKTGKDPRP